MTPRSIVSKKLNSSIFPKEEIGLTRSRAEYVKVRRQETIYVAIMQAQPRGSDRQCGRFTQRHSFLYTQLVIFELTGTICCEPYQFSDSDKVHRRLATNVE